MKKFFLAAVLALTFSNISEAGPIRTWFANHRPHVASTNSMTTVGVRSCPTCPSSGVNAIRGAFPTKTPATACPTGTCPAAKAAAPAPKPAMTQPKK